MGKVPYDAIRKVIIANTDTIHPAAALEAQVEALGQLWQEAAASTRLDGETQVIEGPVHVGEPLPQLVRAPVELQIMLPPQAEWDITDYRELLSKYMDHVVNIVDTAFLDTEDRNRTAKYVEFTDEEWAVLLQLQDEE